MIVSYFMDIYPVDKLLFSNIYDFYNQMQVRLNYPANPIK